jgi:two-component sensor histidine kinase
MKNTLFVVWPRIRHPALLRYGATLMIVGVAFLIRMASVPFVTQSPLLLFIPAVFLASILFGVSSGVIATFASDVLASTYLRGQPVLPSLVSLVLFTAIGFLISMTVEKLHESLRLVRSSEAEKSLLLEELNHRTRNDLMMVSSTLSLQAKTTGDPAVRNALEAAVNRIGVISKAQERLGTTAGHRGFVELGAYLQSLCDGLAELLRDVRPIALRVSTPELEVLSNQAVGVGLIVNELVTNALKHAFPGDMGGVISVVVTLRDEGLCLIVEDDGVGCPKVTGGLGSRLVRLLASQYDGRFEREPQEQGCRVRVVLRSIQIKKR